MILSKHWESVINSQSTFMAGLSAIIQWNQPKERKKKPDSTKTVLLLFNRKVICRAAYRVYSVSCHDLMDVCNTRNANNIFKDPYVIRSTFFFIVQFCIDSGHKTNWHSVIMCLPKSVSQLYCCHFYC